MADDAVERNLNARERARFHRPEGEWVYPINGVTGHDWFEDAARTARRDTVAQALINAASATRHRASVPVVVLAAATEQIAPECRRCELLRYGPRVGASPRC